MILQSGAVLLRPWRVEDARWYVEARDEEIYRWTTERRMLTVAEAEAAIEQANSLGLCCFAIFDLELQELAGNLALVFAEEDRKRAEVMYWLAAPARGRGLGSQAVALVCRWAFAARGLERVTLQTYAGNLRSQRLAERLGFQRMPAEANRDNKAERIWYVLEKNGN